MGTERTRRDVAGSTGEGQRKKRHERPSQSRPVPHGDARACLPCGLKTKDLLRRHGFEVEDHWLKSRAETDAFKAHHKVETTPQTFIDGVRIGGYNEVRAHLGKPLPDPNAVSYRPVIAVFAMTALMALAADFAAGGAVTWRALQWFIAFSMCALAMLKLQDVEKFSTMFLNYDLLARRWVPYSYIYPFAEALAGVLMIAGRRHVAVGAGGAVHRRHRFGSRCSRRSISTSAN